MAVQVFISYARRDGTDAAAAFRRYLQTAGFAAWLDVRDIPGGAEWGPELRTAIYESDAVILLVTPGGAVSTHVQQEIDTRAPFRSMSYLVIGGAPVPEFAARLQYIDVPDTGAADAFAQLAGSLKAIWERIRAQLETLRFEAASDLRPLLEQLSDFLGPHYPRCPIRPEVFHIMVEAIRRMTVDITAGQSFESVMLDFVAGSYVRSDWQYERAYAAYRDKVDNVLRLFSDRVKLPEVKVVHVVPIVMTATEAQHLSSGTAFGAGGHPLQDHFQNVAAMLQTKGIADWIQRYHDVPEHWQPFDSGPQGRTLRDLLQAGLNRWRTDTAYGAVLKLNFIDIRTINDPVNRKQLRRLQTEGCVVLIDLVSVCHPQLFEQYRRSLLDVFPNTLLTKVAPFEPVPVWAESFTVTLQQVVDSFFYERYQLDEDARCARAGTDLEFRGWIRDKLAPYITDHVRATTVREFYRPR